MTRMRAHTRGVRKEQYISRHTSAASINKHYDMLQQLGSGSFGTVNLVRSKATGQEHVCKVVDTSNMHPEVYVMMKREVDLLSQLDHPLVVSLYEYAEDLGSSLSMVLEYIPGGSCASLLMDASMPLGESFVGRLIQQLLVALGYCHAHDVVHRDVKPENMMLARKPTDAGDFVCCKLIDFGVATGMKRELREKVGTPAYMAPEVVRRAPYTEKTDLWSAGVSAIELLTRELPFGNGGPDHNYQNILDAICRYTGTGELQDFLNQCSWWQGRSKKVLNFLLSLLKVNPSSRPDADEALGSQWMERCAPARGSFTKEMARSLELYSGAPEVVRCCLFSIVARGGIASRQERQEFSAAFLAADGDCDGLVTKRDLEEALGYHPLWSLFGSSNVDVDELLDAANLDHSAGLNFTEFMAACLYSRHDSLTELAEEAFVALDDDRDDKVRVEDIEHLFRERDWPFLNTLPQNRPFDLGEWTSCVHRFYEEETPKQHSPSDLNDFFGFFKCRQHAASSGAEIEICN